MSMKEAKKLRKAVRYNSNKYLKAYKAWPWRNRLGLAWWLLFGRMKV